MYGIRAARASLLAAANASAMGSAIEGAEAVGHLGQVLVAPPGHADHVVAGLTRVLEQPRDRVRGLECREDALEAGELPERAEGLLVRHRLVPGAPGVPELRVLRSDARIVEARRNRMGLEDLAFLVGED